MRAACPRQAGAGRSDTCARCLWEILARDQATFSHIPLPVCFRIRSPSFCSPVSRRPRASCRYTTLQIRGSCPVRAGYKAVPAPDAPVIIDNDRALLIFVGCGYGADLDTGRILAVNAGAGNKTPADRGVRPCLFFQHNTVDHPGGSLFSATQAMVQAWQPMHLAMSITMPHLMSFRFLALARLRSRCMRIKGSSTGKLTLITNNLPIRD